ncbi:MAG: YhgE/Pip domain-containing protein [Methanobrevibacter sp.]|uniref:YhgE/Pip domain-containing protein n=1 Tax=Methanobrevibacter sp. TaxID=66852 RepID=UPI0025FFA412|nr:YhgE/Pip domain-containing protein [Methanobrevibacter sp.]MBR0271335.1 YhgE/Pip domain-containing protein [Methanobrevibacter sp.]
MGNITEIIKNDIRTIYKNPIVVLILLVVIILPSLYAVLNVDACWDMYGNTDELSFAIANLDNGSSYNGEKINVGNGLVDELKNNTDFKWTFVSEDNLHKGVENGTYYGGIVIPKNFSEQIISITTDDPHQAQLEFYANSKTNPIGSRLADSGAKEVYRTMNAKIVEFINVAAYGKLGELQDGLSSGSIQLSSGAVQLSSGASQVSSGASEVSSGASKINDGVNEVSSGASQVSSSSSQVQDSAKQLEEASSQLPDPIKPYVESSVKLANASGQVAEGASSLAKGSVSLAEGSGDLANGALSLAAGSQLLANSASSALFTAAYSLSAAAGSLDDITGIDEDKLGDYFYSPIKLEKHDYYSADTFGSQIAPFYIVLSMWIGGVITSVMIKPGTSAGTKYRPIELYFARLVLFILISILQTIVTLTGISLLGMNIANPALFVFSTFFVAAILMILMYSFVSAFGTVGKVFGIILLVLQISSTGGIYPAELTESFFRALNPIMPMTHAITMIRESMLGTFWPNYHGALIYLVCFGFATIVISVVIKRFYDEKAQYLEDKMKNIDLL